MELLSAVQLLSFMLVMFVLVCTGTAWFVALHPRFFWRMIQGQESADPRSSAYYRTLRFAGLCCGAAGLLVLMLDW